MKGWTTRSFDGNYTCRKEGEQRYIDGFFAVFGDVYELWPGATESIAPGAFAESVDGDVRALIDHETRLVLGRTKSGTMELREEIPGLYASIAINEKDSDAVNVMARVERGDVTQGSFGFDVLDEEVTYGEDGSIHWTVKKVKLYEVSVCTFPAYEGTAVEARRKEYKHIHKRKMEARILRAKERLSKC